MSLAALAALVRSHPGLLAKRTLREVASALGGDGDDAAVLPGAEGHLVLAAESILPALVAERPRVAGVAGVVTVLNDIAASGGRPLALLDTVVAGREGAAREVLEGLAGAACLYRVPVVGGHTTVLDGAPSLSTFALGRAARPLASGNARPGDVVSFATSLEGELVDGPEGTSFFSHLRGPRRARAAEDLGLLADAAESGEAWAARDVSMPGLAGSLLQLLESAGGLGCALRAAEIPVPDAVTLGQWLVTFPSYGFLLVGDPDALAARFAAAGLVCREVGRLDDTGVLRLTDGRDVAPVWDLGREPLTGFRRRG